MAVQGTTNYVYFVDQSLGVGATGCVYLGRHKRQGSLCACKVFRADGGPREAQAKQREFEVMKKLNHENIVKFLAIEPESRGTAQILIMEYCAGGSVYKMLEDPENALGFPEDEFIIFLRDISKALKYLRESDVVHRDIKPGNILRCIKDDLRSVYKLTDFGAARVLKDANDEFTSLYGTEEYLHPEVYSRALLGNRRANPLNASIDLWSLGVTIYHVATGRLPFQSFGGRQNKEEMHRIISQKKSGFISGVQRTQQGDIEWDRDLPKTCQLSRGLRSHLQKVLSGLLESDERKQWSFDTFFTESNRLTSRQPLHFYCVATGNVERLYLLSSSWTLAHVQDELASLTGLPASRQKLIHCRTPVDRIIPAAPRRTGSDSSVRPSDAASSASSGWKEQTSPELPIFLLSTIFSASDWQLGTLDIPPKPELVSGGSPSDDFTTAKVACSFVIALQRNSQRFIYCQTQTINCIKFLLDRLYSRYQSLLAGTGVLSQLSAPGRRGNSASNSPVPVRHHQLVPSGSKTNSAVRNATPTQLRASSAATTGSCEQTVDGLLTSVQRLIDEFDMKLFESYMAAVYRDMCRPEHRCVNKLEKCKQELVKILDDFREHKRKELTYNEQQIHKFDRMRIVSLAEKAFKHFTEHCCKNMKTFIRTTAQWYSNMYMKYEQEISLLDELLTDTVSKMLCPALASPSATAGRPIGFANPQPSPNASTLSSRPALNTLPQSLQSSSSSGGGSLKDDSSQCPSYIQLCSDVPATSPDDLPTMQGEGKAEEGDAGPLMWKTKDGVGRGGARQAVEHCDDDSGIGELISNLKITMSESGYIIQDMTQSARKSLALAQVNRVDDSVVDYDA